MVRDTNHFHHFEDGVCSCMVLALPLVCLVNLPNQIHFLYSVSSDSITPHLVEHHHEMWFHWKSGHGASP
jgi:hypothetical protein